MTRFPTLAAALLALAAGAAGPALAQADPDAAPSMRVQLADVNFASPEGRAVALVRVEKAAKALCGEEVRAADIEGRQRILKCRREAEETALAQINRQLQASAGRGTEVALLVGR